MKRNRQEKGITLIALVVTIIILLILAGVTLGTVLSDGGLIDKTKEAIGKYEDAEGKEQEELGKVTGMLANALDGLGSTGGTTTPDTPPTPPKADIPSEMEIGDTVNYTPKTTTTSYELPTNKSGYTSVQNVDQQTYTWKVLSINDDSVDIMGVPTSSMPTVYFRGATGYNNGVYVLDEMCKELYSNSDLKTEARSLDLQDIESKMNAKGIEARSNYGNSGSGTIYGDTKDYTESVYRWYPNLAEYENTLGIDDGGLKTDGIGESDDGTNLAGQITIPLLEEDVSSSSSGHYTSSKTQASSKITVKQNYYYFSSPSAYFDDSKFYNLIFGTGTSYWLASRSSECSLSFANFGLRGVYNANLSGSDMFGSYGHADESACRVAPVVSLKSNIQYTSAGEGVWDIEG